MVIHEKKPEEPKVEPQDFAKKRILEDLSQYSLAVITLAHLYATNFEAVGADVTQRWVTAQQQTEILQAAYNQGYEDALEKMKGEK